MSRLEAGYRRLLRLYPRAHRSARAEEMLAVLLDAAPRGQRAVTAAESVDLVRGAAGAHVSGLGRRAARRPGTAAATVTLVVALALAVAPGSVPDPAAARALPDAFAGYSPLTGTVGHSPPGPAVALYRQGSGAELFDAPQTVVAGASGAYRRLDLAERRGGMQAEVAGDQARFDARQAEPAPAALSPNGARVAVGVSLRDSTDGAADPVRRGTAASDDTADSGLDVAVQDLTTGKVVRHALGSGRDALPVAWSPDGRSLAVLVHQAPPGLRYAPERYHPDVDRSGWLAVVDTSSGAVRRVEPKASWRPESAAFSPDGRRLAVQDEAGTLSTVTLADGSVADLGQPDLYLTSGSAWSPDGALLLGMRRSTGADADDTGCIAFVSLTAAAAPGCLPTQRYGQSTALGWTGARSIAITAERGAAGDGVERVDVLDVDVRDGSAHRTSSIPSRGGDVTASAVDVAGDVLRFGETAAAPATDHGRWPVALRLVAAALAAALAALVARAGTAAGRSLRRRTAAG